MSKPISISSLEELEALSNSNDYTLVDFWATWCPPCKAIAPVYEKLAAQNTQKDQLAFAKVDVDAQATIAKKYNISAMPTFILLNRGGVPIKAVRGADAKGIQALITYAKKKVASEHVSEDEEKAYDANVQPSSSPGILMPLLVVIGIWYFFFKK
ncbi:thioredoxin-domain-containing protein, partial [Byssothecium circinans]